MLRPRTAPPPAVAATGSMDTRLPSGLSSTTLSLLSLLTSIDARKLCASHSPLIMLKHSVASFNFGATMGTSAVCPRPTRSRGTVTAKCKRRSDESLVLPLARPHTAAKTLRASRGTTSTSPKMSRARARSSPFSSRGSAPSNATRAIARWPGSSLTPSASTNSVKVATRGLATARRTAITHHRPTTAQRALHARSLPRLAARRRCRGLGA